MRKIFTIFTLAALAAISPLQAEGDQAELEKVKKDRERLIDLVLTLQEDFGGTLKDYARLQEDYAALLKKKDTPDHSAEVAELRKKLEDALTRLKNQAPAEKSGSSHALLEQDLVNLRNELHDQRQELLVARARVLRVKQLEEQNQSLQQMADEEKAKQLATAKELKAIQSERDGLMEQLKKSMASFEKAEEARKKLLVRLDQLEKENLALKKTVEEQKARIAELSTIEEEHQKALAAAAELEKENVRLNQLLDDHKKKLINLQEHLAAEVKRTLEIPVLIQAQEELKSKLTESEAQTKLLTEDKEILTARKAELEAEIATVKENIAAMSRQLEENKNAMASLNQLRAQNEELKTEKTNLEQTLDMAKAELVKSMGTRKRLEMRLAETEGMAATNAELKQKNTALMEEQGLLHDQLAKTQSTLDASKKLTDELQASMLELAKEKADLTNEITRNEAQIEKLRAEVAREPGDEGQLEKLEKEKQDLADQLKAREEDLKKTRIELGKLQISATVAKNELVSLKRTQTTIDPVRYALGEAEITEQQNRVLGQVQEVLKNFPHARFEIVGHTCDIGKADANLKLSQKRARSLHDFLVAKGIPKDRLKSRGVGQSDPMVPNTSEKNRRLNRRVVVEILD